MKNRFETVRFIYIRTAPTDSLATTNFLSHVPSNTFDKKVFTLLTPSIILHALLYPVNVKDNNNIPFSANSRSREEEEQVES